ncbi:hypothetical protein F5148DRAFT_226170 [Russula earlei]|uniref:Uncharacterized protein n=1 Tax=Russula earlei TaxID=71964 RepID=A0ACC0UJ48_9AGAM|nr:hypothetical protein F5148DRAFT_226170 [Russula earlei]
MSTNLAPTVRLHNYFQGIGQTKSISYLEKDNGPTAENRWSVTVKINGEAKGSCDAPRKSAAKEGAAEQALKRLGLE